ncbi:DUF2110 family protein [Candidatus Heimdallarchaeota archaeon]|nr:MAG: DUF2110 family protein [Candidatus Heimdallarchaeota archaeon]
MLTVSVLEKTYNVARHSSIKAFTYILTEELKGLDVEIIEVTFNKDKCAEITIDGEDELVAKNLLIKNYGTQRSIGNIQEGDEIYGRCKDVGGVKFGFFIDAGITSTTEKIDALYPLFELREQLAKGNKTPLMEIMRAYGITENLPLFFEITKRRVIGSKVWVRLTEKSLNWIAKPAREKKDALIVCGTTRRAIKNALITSNHTEDIEEVERIGLLEYRLICKRGTRAEGIIPEIGYLLGRAKIGAQVYSRVKELLE